MGGRNVRKRGWGLQREAVGTGTTAFSSSACVGGQGWLQNGRRLLEARTRAAGEQG